MMTDKTELDITKATLIKAIDHRVSYGNEETIITELTLKSAAGTVFYYVDISGTNKQFVLTRSARNVFTDFIFLSFHDCTAEYIRTTDSVVH